MSPELAIILWLVIVVASAVVASYFAHRWGRDPFGWILLCAALGPIALIGLVGTHQSDRARSRSGAAADAAREKPIVVACDGSAVSARLGEHAAMTYRAGDAVILLAVLPYDAQQQGEDAEQRGRVESMTALAKRSLDHHGVPSRTVVRYGPPGEVIVAFAEEVSASLLILGRRGSGLSRALLGSVSGHVTQHAAAPVLVVD